MHMKRRLFLASALGVSAAVPAYAKFVEPEWLRFHQVDCNFFHERQSDPIRLLHLSDLHASPQVPKRLIEHAIDIGLSAKPDLICVTGDFITTGEPFDGVWLEQQLRRLSSAAPAFGSLGNHDGGPWAIRWSGLPTTDLVGGIVKAGGLKLLRNSHTELLLKGRSLNLVGLGDWWADELDAAKAFPEPSSIQTLLLSHNPDTKELLTQYQWSLMLSGHTHGGQFALPLLGTPFAPVVDRRYVEGLKPWQERQIHVTTGVGNLYGVRFNCRPEVSLLLLH